MPDNRTGPARRIHNLSEENRQLRRKLEATGEFPQLDKTMGADGLVHIPHLTHEQLMERLDRASGC